jgi:glycosyltransferase involved in cell wall biosynthesis
MKFSIVTLAFRQRRFIREAIESVLSQDYADIEYIVVDPGSPDGTREIVDEYATQISHRIYEPDAGPADGLNKGLAIASGDVFAFVNGDDLLLPGAISAVARRFAAEPQLDILAGDGYVCDAAGTYVRHIRACAFTARNLLYGGASWLQQSTFIRRAAYESTGGFNPENRTSWDGELFLCALDRGARVGYLRRDLGVFRIYDESITGSGALRDAYRRDHARMFRASRGRDLTPADALIGWLYRSKRLLLDPGALRHAVGSRLKRVRARADGGRR